MRAMCSTRPKAMNIPVKIMKARIKLATGPASTIAARLRSGCPARVMLRSTSGSAEPAPPLDARDICVAVEFHVAAERQRSDSPARAVRIDASGEFGAEAERERVDFDAASPCDKIVTEFMEEHDRAQDHEERDHVPSEARRAGPPKKCINAIRDSAPAGLGLPAAAGQTLSKSYRTGDPRPRGVSSARPRYGELPALAQRLRAPRAPPPLPSPRSSARPAVRYRRIRSDGPGRPRPRFRWRR